MTGIRYRDPAQRTRPRRVLALALPALLLTATLALAVGGQRYRRDARMGGTPPDVEYVNVPYDGRFTFARIRFQPSWWGFTRQHAWGLDLSWNHDYPRGDRRLQELVGKLTGVTSSNEGSNIVRLTDPELFQYPWAYLCEVGSMTLSDDEVESFRAYLLKGGFVVVDDFNGGAWGNFLEQMQRVIPGGEFIELDESHPLFHSFYDIDDLRFGGGTGYGSMGYGYPYYLGLFEANDPSKRLMMIANYNNDIGEYWEWSESPYVDVDLSNDAFKLGINYVIYSMLH